MKHCLCYAPDNASLNLPPHVPYIVEHVLPHCNDIHLNKKDTMRLFGILYGVFEEIRVFKWNPLNAPEVVPIFNKILSIIHHIRSAMSPRNTVFVLVLEETLRTLGILPHEPHILNVDPQWCAEHVGDLNAHIANYLIQPVNIIRNNMLQDVCQFIHENSDITIIRELIKTCPTIDVQMLTNKKLQTMLHIICVVSEDEEDLIASCLQSIPIKKLQRFINLQRRDDENTALHLASQFGKINMVTCLVKYGASTSLTNSLGQTALDVAASENIINLLKKADLFDSPFYANGNLFTSLLLKNYPKEEPLPKEDIDLLKSAITNAEVEMVEVILKRNKNLINETNNFGLHLLLKAIGVGNVDIVRLLLQSGADTAGFARGMNPLHYAVKKGDVRIVEVLLDYVDNVNAIGDSDHTALHYATGNGNVAIAKLLLAHGANFEAADNLNQTPLKFSINEEVSNVLKTIGNLHRMAQEDTVTSEEYVANVFLKLKSSLNNDMYWKATNNDDKTVVQLINERKGTVYRWFKTLFLYTPSEAGS